MKILLSNVKMADNFGYPSIVLAFETLMKRKNSKIEINYEGKASNKREAKARERYGMKTLDLSTLYRVKTFPLAIFHAVIFRCFKHTIGNSKYAKDITKLAEYSALIDLVGICYSDKIKFHPLKKFFQVLWINRLWLIAKIIRIPVIKNTTAVGPVTGLSSKIRAKIDLGYLCGMVIARDEESYDIFKMLKLHSRYLLKPDTAFCMKKGSCDKAELLKNMGKPVIGIGVSHQIEGRIENIDYCKLISKIIIELIEKHNAHIVLIPNEFNTALKRNDVVFAEKIKEMLSTYEEIEILNSASFRADELKGIIASCEVIITARYHTMVAALSTCTPVFAMSWHHKYKTAMGLFGLEKYVVENYEMDKDYLNKRITTFYDERQKIRGILNNKIQSVIKEVETGIDQIYEFILIHNKN